MTRFRASHAVSTLALIAATPFAAHAQETATPAAQEADGGLQEIIVTAEKRESNVQKTAIAIDVVTSDKLAKNGVANMESLQAVAPGIQFGQSGANTIVTVRGVSGRDTSEIGDPAVAINMDGIFLQRPAGMNAAFFDLDRIEVLRGPQGTLYGRNATGGVINVVSKRPELGDFGGYAAVDAGNYNTINLEAAVNIPVGDTIAIRASGIRRERDGFRDVGNGQRGDDEYSRGGRLQALFKPNDSLSVLLSGGYLKQSGFGPVQAGYPTTRAEPPTDWDEVKTIPLNFKNDYDLTRKTLSAQLDYDFGSVKATYLFGYVGVDKDQTFDNDGTATKSYVFRAGEFSDDTSHELRLSSKTGGPFTWQTGLYYYNQDLAVRSQNYVNPNGNVVLLRDYHYDVQVKSKAAFGQISYAFTDQLKASAGIRWSQDTKTRTGYAYNGPSLANPPATQPVLNYAPTDDRSRDSDVSYHVGLDYQATPANLVYAKVDKGYKSGGFTSINAYGPETVIAYEVGSKNRLLGNTLQLNLSGFIYDYKDQQVSQTTNQGVQVLNAGNSRVKGIEAQVEWKASNADSIDLSINWLDAKFKKFAVNTGGVNVDLAGNHLIQAPEWSLSGGYQHVFELANGGDITPRVQATYRSTSYLTFYNRANDRQKPYETVDASLTYTAPENAWSLQAYVRNLTNSVILTGASIGSFTGTNFYQFAAPRTYGVRLQGKF
ncbi:TonB-dependent receptor [Sphingomonas sp. LH128]|uniref:TonB-dependent receptor n=1 Tax=Sphingomonas sp. LH128 TaxID=473781 RepID=UPI00027CA0E1|nr:TonB-dependent receptor [Sphingomonas sp. LH128]EJU08926.1 TonB-dependent receptor [Sphingomonas sp. LH128]